MRVDEHDERARERLSYLGECARVLGTRPDGREAPYSLAWFYEHAEACLGPVAWAFLGDGQARAALDLVRDPADGEADGLLEGTRPNERQLAAIRRALANAVSLVQGPPGTGKTATILNMVSCMLARGATVAVVSSNNAALDHIAEKVAEYARADAREQSNRRRVHDAFARLGGRDARLAWSQAHPDEPVFSDRLGSSSLGIGGWEPQVRAADFLARHPFVTSSAHSLMKCFFDGDVCRYDYLIMDEASQCDLAAGVVALSCARHVVLVGDDEQLSPVYNEAAEPRLPEATPAVAEGPYRLRDEVTDEGRSILSAVRAALPDAPHTFLNEHYRCHPGIIDFCSREVYATAEGSEPLVVRTHDYDRSVEVPIRIRWFEGNYCERAPVADGSEDASEKARPATRGHGSARPSKRNLRQVAVFMEEEWPRLRARMEADPSVSACILSPYRGQLSELARALGEASGGTHVFELADVDGRRAVADGEVGAPERVPAMLTVHKSQGQEFDVVYLLPVEDGDWEYPWSQGRRLVNVAVSRARSELVVVTSSCLMEERVQCELTGHVVRPVLNASLSAEERDAQERRQRFVKKLVSYVFDRLGGARAVGDFGFHRSRLRSVFDRVAFTDLPRGHALSRPEACMAEALGAIDLSARGLAVAREVPLRELDVDFSVAFTDACGVKVHEKCAFVGKRALRLGDEADERVSHLDFVVYEVASRRLVLAVEVDGGLHRTTNRDRSRKDTPEELAHRRHLDKIKDAVMVDLGAEVVVGPGARHASEPVPGRPAFTFLRVSTDGTSWLETEALCAEAGARTGGPTIEELIDCQLARGLGGAPAIGRDWSCDDLAGLCPSGWKTITELLRDLKSELPELGSMSSATANRALERAGLIERRDGEKGWFATKRGEEEGVMQLADGSQRGFNPYCKYGPQATGVVREALLAACRVR